MILLDCCVEWTTFSLTHSKYRKYCARRNFLPGVDCTLVGENASSTFGLLHYAFFSALPKNTPPRYAPNFGTTGT